MKNLLLIGILNLIFSYYSFAQISFNINPTSGCNPLTVNFQNTSSDPNAYYYYLYWGNGAEYTGIDSTNSLDTTYTYTFPESYYGYSVYFRVEDRFTNFLGDYYATIYVYGGTQIYMPDSVCPYEEVDFHVTEDADSYNWNFGDGATLISTDNNARHTYTIPGTYYIKAILSFSCGLDTLLDTIHVNNNALPYLGSYPNVYISPNPVCPNDKVEFDMYAGNSEAYNKLWNFGGGNTSIEHEPIFSFSSTGNKPISVTITNSCGNQTTLYDTVNVQNNLPLGNIDIDIEPNPVCPGNNIYFSARADNGGTYQWNLGVTTNNNKDVSIAYLDTVNHPVSVSIQNGCGRDTTIYNTVVMKTNLPVNNSFYPLIAPNPACPDDVVTFDVLGEPSYKYKWFFGDGQTSDIKHSLHSYSSTATLPISLIITNGCGNDTILSDIMKIKNNIFPQLVNFANQEGGDGDFSFHGRFGTPNEYGGFCPNDSALFVVFGNFSSLLWDFGDGHQSSNATQTTLYLGEGGADSKVDVYISRHAYQNTGTYNVKLTVGNGCGNYTSDSFDVIIGNNFQVEADFVVSPPAHGGNFLPCEKIKFLSFNASSYRWDFGDGTVIVTSNGEIEHSYASSGTYQVKLTTWNGCGDTAKITIPIYIQEIGGLNANFSATPRSGAAPLEVQFINTTTNAALYEWNFGDGNTSTETNPIHTYTEGGGIYNVTLKAKTVCGAEDVRSQIGYITTGYITISGTVYNDTITDTIKAGNVFLYRKNGNKFDSLTSASINANGTYQITNAIKGQYYILAKPTINQYPNNLPTYYPNTVQWFNANVFNANQSTNTANIFVKKLNATTGTGTIAGMVIEAGGTGKIQGPGDPLGGVDLSLIDKSTASPIALAESETTGGNEGGFSFNNVPNSNYSIYVDITGVPIDAGFEIPINAENQSVYVLIIVDSNLISFDTSNHTGLVQYWKPNANTSLKVYPNPSNSYVNISYNLENSQNVQLGLYNVLGSRISTLVDAYQVKGQYNYIMNLTDKLLVPGFYILKLQSDNVSESIRILYSN